MNSTLALTPEQQHDAEALRAIWDALPDAHRNEERAAATIGTTPEAVKEYVSGETALNLDALIGFCEYLNVQPADISPRLTRTLQRGTRLLECPELEQLKKTLEMGVNHGKLSGADLGLLQTTVTRFIATATA